MIGRDGRRDVTLVRQRRRRHIVAARAVDDQLATRVGFTQLATVRRAAAVLAHHRSVLLQPHIIIIIIIIIIIDILEWPKQRKLLQGPLFWKEDND